MESLCDLSGRDISGLDLSHFRIENVNFRGSLCRCTKFPPLVDCLFDDAEATRAIFSTLRGCSFTGTLLGGARFGARMQNCAFVRASMMFCIIGCNLQDIANHYKSNKFDEADMRNVDARRGYFAGTSFKRARLGGARLSGSNLAGCDFSRASLVNANLIDASIKDAVFFEADFGECYLSPDVLAHLSPNGAVQAHPLMVCKTDGLGSNRLDGALSRFNNVDLVWLMQNHRTRRIEKILLWKDADVSKAAGVAVFDAGDEPLHNYAWQIGHSIHETLMKIRDDYAGWHIQLDTLSVAVESRSTDSGIASLVRQSLLELFSY